MRRRFRGRRKFPPQQPQEDGTWRAGPIRIEKKTSFTALSAFFLSVLAFFSAVWGILYGNELRITADDVVLLFAQRCYNTRKNEITFEPAVAFSFYTAGYGGNSIVIKSIELSVLPNDSDGISWKYTAEYFISHNTGSFDKNKGLFDTQRSCAEMRQKKIIAKNGLDIKIKESFRPIIVESGRSREVSSLSFRPSYDPSKKVENYRASFSEFLARFLDEKNSKPLRLNIRFSVDNTGYLYGLLLKYFPIELKCNVVRDSELGEILVEREFAYPNFDCSS